MPGLLSKKGVFDLLSPRQALTALWGKGLSGSELLLEHTSIIDEFIEQKFYTTFNHEISGICLVALGGYGRRELFPYSDIDLLLLFEEHKKDLIEGVLDAVFYPLWDAGLEIGHSVRTIHACMEDIKKDFF